ncbi:Attacin_C domain-containing protein [Sergentomyia squamirostris]
MISVKIVFFVVCAISASCAFEYPRDAALDELYTEDLGGEYEEVFVPIPVAKYRVRRQVFGGVSPGPQGGIAGTFGGRGTLYENNGHKVDGHASVSRNWHPTGPTTIGGGLDYTGPRGSASISATHPHHFGTTVNAEGRANLYTSPNRMTSIDAHGGYQRHFGGPFGTSKPNYNVGLGLSHRF